MFHWLTHPLVDLLICCLLCFLCTIFTCSDLCVLFSFSCVLFHFHWFLFSFQSCSIIDCSFFLCRILSSSPPGWTNRMFWWTIYPSKSLWFENNSFILDLYFCFLHSILHMFSFSLCLSLIASMLPKYLGIFLHSMHVSNQIFLFTNYFFFIYLYLLFVYLPLIDLFFLHSLCIIDYWWTNPPFSHSFMVWFFKHLDPSVIHLFQTSLFMIVHS